MNLKKTIKVLIKQRGNDADLNDIDVSCIVNKTDITNMFKGCNIKDKYKPTF